MRSRILQIATGVLTFLLFISFTFNVLGVLAAKDDTPTTPDPDIGPNPSSIAVEIPIGSFNVSFSDDTTPSENAKRIEEITIVNQLLPKEFLDRLVDVLGVRIPIVVWSSPEYLAPDWASGSVKYGYLTYIYEQSNPEAYPYDWEHFAENGYSSLERIKILIHEIGHVANSNITTNAEVEAFNALCAESPESVTKYGNRNCREAFADSFTFYVLWSDYLKENYPERYTFMREFFGGATFEPMAVMPSSVKSRLYSEWNIPTPTNPEP